MIENADPNAPADPWVTTPPCPSPRELAACHARDADITMRRLRDSLDNLPGFERQSVALTRAISAVYDVRESLRKPAPE